MAKGEIRVFNPDQDKPVKVVFKHEGHEKGEIIGPVWVHLEEMAAEPNFVTGKPEHLHVAYESDDDFETTAWYPLWVAQEIAEDLGVELIQV